jgi:hypothetical protein
MAISFCSNISVEILLLTWIVLAMLSDVYDTYDTQTDKTNFFPKFDTAPKLMSARKYEIQIRTVQFQTFNY